MLMSSCYWLTVVVGVNLLIGTDGGMMLLDRSGQGKGLTCCLFSLMTCLAFLLFRWV